MGGQPEAGPDELVEHQPAKVPAQGVVRAGIPELGPPQGIIKGFRGRADRRTQESPPPGRLRIGIARISLQGLHEAIGLPLQGNPQPLASQVLGMRRKRSPQAGQLAIGSRPQPL